MPNAIAMTSEYNPHRRRATMVMIMFCGFSIGAALGGFLAADLIPRFGWRSVFLVGGIAPLIMVPILVWRLPESVRFVATTGQAPERIAGLLKAGKSNEAMIEEMYLLALSRPPSDRERQALLAEAAQAMDRREFFEDLGWSLVNSKEFQFRH